MFTPKDIDQIRAHGVDLQTIQTQMDNFRAGFPYLKIVAPASVGHGIKKLSDEEVDRYAAQYDQYRARHKVVKFVPASGAATRMFHHQHQYLQSGEMNPSTRQTLRSLDRFAFYEQLSAMLPEGADERQMIAAIIGPQGLDYGSRPKALLAFHRYGGQTLTAFEEHLCEAAGYATSHDGCARIHFTISPEHESGFAELVRRVKPAYEKLFGIKYKLSFSTQHPATDTVAVCPDNTPFRNADSSLVFRPAGHGALLRNLGAINADVVFIKNIDNVTTHQRRGDTLRYKRALGGLLTELQGRAFAYSELLRQHLVSAELLAEIGQFITRELCVELPEKFQFMTTERLRSNYKKLLNRPIRVCGMVRNEKEPGGGPFWVENKKGYISLQIAEPPQISPADRHLIQQSTHFNPVDIVCSLKNYKGRKFDLTRFAEPSMGLIVEKSKDGRPLRAQELPGLWNGSMAKWNTVFVEVPLSTFTPVKELNDLLRPEHQQ